MPKSGSESKRRKALSTSLRFWAELVEVGESEGFIRVQEGFHQGSLGV